MKMLRVVKVDKNNIDVYHKKITTSMLQEYNSIYHQVVSKSQYLEHKTTYLLKYTYALVWKHEPTSKERLLGYFSLSSCDLLVGNNVLTNIYDKMTKTFYLFDVYVFPTYRGRGIGKYLVKQALEYAHKEHDARTVKLYTLNNGLSNFYNKNAFTNKGHFVIYGIRLLVMEWKRT